MTSKLIKDSDAILDVSSGIVGRPAPYNVPVHQLLYRAANANSSAAKKANLSTSPSKSNANKKGEVVAR